MNSNFFEKERISGLETENEQWILKKLEKDFSEIHVDCLGNVFAENEKKSGQKTLLLATHWDEPGFIVTKITEDGYLKFDPVGKIPKEAMLSKKVKINGCTGVISLKAIHLSSKEERKKPIDPDKLFVDIGTDSKKAAEQIAMEGDYFTFEQDVCMLGPYLTGRGMDSAAAMDILLDAAREITDYHVILLFYAQHHVGMRGLRAAISDVKADAAVLLEGIDRTKRKQADNENLMSDGNLLCYATQNYLAPCNLFKKAEHAADCAGITVQNMAADITDEAEFIAAKGIPTVYLGLNCRYQNTAVCMVHKNDMENARQLIVKIAAEI